MRISSTVDHVGRGANARSVSKAIRRGRRPLRTRCFDRGVCGPTQIRSWLSGHCEFRHQIVLGDVMTIVLGWCNLNDDGVSLCVFTECQRLSLAFREDVKMSYIFTPVTNLKGVFNGI